MILRPSRGWYFLLFTVSGAAGLVYESIWSHYLKLFLGHAAYAQTLVLAIFMGGMALGAWICSRRSARWPNLLLGYAIVEAAIGVLAVVFHPVFVGATAIAHDAVLPALGEPWSINGFKWLLAALLVLPQSVLLGMTFPLMSAGVIRAFPGGRGDTIAMLYFTNSLGAAAGVLLSGFVLIQAIGLPGTVLLAGVVNLLLAAAVWLLARNRPARAQERALAPSGAQARPESGRYRLLLGVSLLTGAASFMYEIGWIRMLTMVLGSSSEAFELMLSAFILGLAFGGLWIKRRIESYGVPEIPLGVIQVLMGILALATLLVYGESFRLMQLLLQAVGRTQAGYALFNTGSHLIASFVMFPAAFCAGMTLPLVTQALLRSGMGERAIGAVYAANTVGAILGVVLATHLAMPLIGLKGLIVLGAGIDIALGLVLLRRYSPLPMVKHGFALAGVLALVATLAAVQLDPLKMASGVYRTGALMAPGQAEVVFHRDGKTATVSLVRAGDLLSITTNGKSDALIDLGPGGHAAHDGPVMVLTGALPVILHPQARSAAVIGIGSGISSHVLLGSETLQEVDTVEIEPAMVEAARGFLPRNEAVFRDRRSRIHIEDAKTFFASRGRRYDLIVSEPSNPWVSGVATLFSEEFYARMRRHLAPGGLFVQWLQLYEIEPALVASVMKALAREFSHYDIYASDDSNVIIVARDGAPVPLPSGQAWRHPRLADDLAKLALRSPADLSHFRVGPREVLQPYFDQFRVAPNSDYFPVLDQGAARSRFMGGQSREIVALARTAIPAIELLGGGRMRSSSTVHPWLSRSRLAHEGAQALAYLRTGDPTALEALPARLRSHAQVARWAGGPCSGAGATLNLEQLLALAEAVLPYVAAGESAPVWQRLAAAGCTSERLQPWLRLFSAIDARDAQAMATQAESLLARAEPERRDFLLSAAIVGRLAQGDPPSAAALWARHARTVASAASDVLPDLLRGHLRPARGLGGALVTKSVSPQ